MIKANEKNQTGSKQSWFWGPLPPPVSPSSDGATGWWWKGAGRAREKQTNRERKMVAGTQKKGIHRERDSRRTGVRAAAMAWGRRSLSPSSWAAALGPPLVSVATHVAERKGAARPRATPRPRPSAPPTPPELWGHHRCPTTDTQGKKQHC